jgi:hypothetical protein
MNDQQTNDINEVPVLLPEKQQNVPQASMLLPTKVHHVGNGQVQPFPSEPPRWTAQDPIEWIESLAAATEAAYPQNPLMLGDVQLSTKIPTPLPLARSQAQVFPNGVSSVPPPPPPNAVQPMYWDLSYVERVDPYALSYTTQMRVSAARLEEGIFAGHQNMGTYHALQQRFEFTFHRIMRQPYPHEPRSIENGELRHLLNTLYEETIEKLKSLAEPPVQETPSARPPQPPPPPVPQQQLPPLPPPPPLPQQTVAKKDIGKYMTNWLRDNWTNPYPDDAGLAEMAAVTGTTPQVISNWLINARTRKWRPSIVKASDMNRPADLLLEDSINIFDGKPVRELPNNDDEGDDAMEHDMWT